MQIIFVGGASAVGASCLAIEIADQWIIVDAGVRVDRKSDPLPDLALLEGKDVRAIFVTHAHARPHRRTPTGSSGVSHGSNLCLTGNQSADGGHAGRRAENHESARR